MQFRSVKRGDFTSGARAVARNMDQIFRANRDSAIDFTSLAKESIKGRSQERRAAMQEPNTLVSEAFLEAPPRYSPSEQPYSESEYLSGPVAEVLSQFAENDHGVFNPIVSETERVAAYHGRARS